MADVVNQFSFDEDPAIATGLEVPLVENLTVVAPDRVEHLDAVPSTQAELDGTHVLHCAETAVSQCHGISLPDSDLLLLLFLKTRK